MIIESLLDTDFYKFTMMQAVLHQFPGAMCEYRFKCRTADVDLIPYADVINAEIDHLCSLSFSKDEVAYINNIRFFKSDFADFLRLFQLNREFIEINTDDGFEIIIRGPWLHTILFEVPILAIVSEVYFRENYAVLDHSEGRDKLEEKIDLVRAHKNNDSFLFSDFGTRRRFSKIWHAYVVERCKQRLSEFFRGTSNVLLAKEFDLIPIGTMAHEYLQACQALGPRLIYSQQFAFEKWAQEYRGELGIALSDICGMDAFFRDFDLYFCKLFDGARHDSGDPFEWGERIIEHYQKMRVDPSNKTIVFSNNLTFPLALQLYDNFNGRINIAFGIGTNLTNDLGPSALQNVIKMVECNGQPVAKVSDDPEKSMCRDASYLAYIKKVFQIS